MLIINSDGTRDTATTLVYSMFEVMRTRGLEVENANPEIVISAIEDKLMKKLVRDKKGQCEKEQTNCITDSTSSKELCSWQKVEYDIEDITPDQTQDKWQVFEELGKAHNTTSNACVLIAAMSTSLKGLGLKTLLQNTVHPLVNIQIPPGLFNTPEAGDGETAEEKSQDDILKEINKCCFPRPSKVKEANDITCALAALVYFKLKQQLICGTHQFEATARYKINQKWLSEILHRKRYLGGMQWKCKVSDTKEDPEVIDDNNNEEEDVEDEEMGDTEKQGQKRKFAEDNDDEDDFQSATQKQFITKPVKKNHLARKKDNK